MKVEIRAVMAKAIFARFDNPLAAPKSQITCYQMLRPIRSRNLIKSLNGIGAQRYEH
jgi:hypothetical protein